MKELNDFEKILLSVVTNLSDQLGFCSASNTYLSEETGGKSKFAISRNLKSLKEKGFIKINEEKELGRSLRKIYPCKGIDANGKGVYANGNPPLTQMTRGIDAKRNQIDNIIEKNNTIVHSVHFEEFWNIYPRKLNKKRSREIWKNKKLDSIANAIISKTQNLIKKEYSQKEAQFIPHPTTFLNGERWEDEPQMSGSESKPSKLINSVGDMF